MTKRITASDLASQIDSIRLGLEADSRVELYGVRTLAARLRDNSIEAATHQRFADEWTAFCQKNRLRSVHAFFLLPPVRYKIVSTTESGGKRAA